MGPVILSSEELARMRRQTEERRAVVATNTEKDTLKELSEARKGTWNNTLEAQRNQREQAKAQRLDDDEEAKCVLDREEASIRATQRQAQIMRANKMLYDQTDRVKSFNSSLLLSDVLQERDLQIDLKRRVEETRERHEAVLVKEREKAWEVADYAEAAKADERKRAALRQRDAQLLQIEQFKTQILAEMREDVAEGELIRRRAAEEEEEEKLRELRKREEAMRGAMETATANAALKEYKAGEEEEEEKLRELRKREEAMRGAMETATANAALKEYKAGEAAAEAAMDRKIEQFARAKERKDAARRVHAEAKNAEKAAVRDAMVARMEADLMARQKKEVEAEDNAAERAEAARDASDALKAAERLEDLRVIELSRQQQLAIKAAERAREREREELFVRQWAQRNEQLQREEEEEKMELFARNKRLQQAHVRQIARKIKKATMERELDLRASLANTRRLEEEDELFDHYARVCMDEWESRGKSLRPMMVELGKFDPNKVT